MLVGEKKRRKSSRWCKNWNGGKRTKQDGRIFQRVLEASDFQERRFIVELKLLGELDIVTL